jgi:hypothetical protein
MTTIAPGLKRAVDRSGDSPLLLRDSETHQSYLLIRTRAPSPKQAVGRPGDFALRLEDSETSRTYLLVAAEDYEPTG